MRRASAAIVWCTWAAAAPPAAAHSGPPFPIVSNQPVGGYLVSIWTDPDTTDDGSPGGQFWVTLQAADAGTAVGGDTRVRLSIRPLERPGPALAASAVPVGGDPGNQYVELVMDHEGLFAVHLTIDGALGRGEVDSQVEATYDLRPPALLLLLYLLPFALVAFLWVKLLVRRRSHAGPGRSQGR